MARSYFPFDAGAGANVTEAQWRQMARNWLGTGVLKGQLNAFAVFADSTGMQVKVPSGRAWIEGHFFESDAQETVAIGAANATNPRIDRVVLRADFTANTVDIAVLAGTPAVTPAAPAVTQSTTVWEISLAQVLVDAAVATIAAGKVTDERTYAGRKLRISHTWTLPGEVKVAVGDTDFICPMFVAEPSAQDVRLVAVRARINSGTSATVKLQHDGADATGFTGISITTADATTDPADVDLTDAKKLVPVVTAVVGTPKNLTITAWLEYTF